MTSRRRFKQTESLQQRLATWVRELRERADRLPSGPERDELIRKARLADTAGHIDEWAQSPGLQPPK